MDELFNIKNDALFKGWITEIKQRIRQSQIKAAVRVNEELLRLYWDLGEEIVNRQAEVAWGSGFFAQLSKELSMEFPHMAGFSKRNLEMIKRWYLFYHQENNPIAQQLVAQLDGVLFAVPWGHHCYIVSKCQLLSEASFYLHKTIENGWSRAALMNFMEADLYHAQGKSVCNFSKLLPAPQSDLARETLKDPYNFDFLTLTADYKERELEDALIDSITKFLLELGTGFAYVGRQVPVIVGTKELYMDLLFYHLELRCYVVVELKARDFEAAYTGQLGVYVSAINHQRKKEWDNPTIGLIICKTKDNILAEYAVEGSSQPIGISEYHLSKLISEDFKSSLPSVKEIEETLKEMEKREHEGTK